MAIMIAELLSLGFVGITTKGLFYSLPTAPILGSNENQKISRQSIIHPYFGFIIPPGKTVESVVVPSGRIRFMTDNFDPLPGWVSLKSNNHGFWSAYDYPLLPHSEDNFIVGIFGGSVAQWLTVQAGDYLENELAHLPVLEGKQVYIMNMANGGFKQPQQLLVLSYFMAIGQHFDLIINLDGFNEIALPDAENLPKGIHYSMPRSYPKNVSSMTSIADLRMIRWLNDGLDLREQSNYWAGMANFRLSAGFYLLASALHARAQSLSEAHMLTPPSIGENERTNFFVLDSTSKGDNSNQQKSDLVDLWLQSSILMRDMAEQNNAMYLHVLQPNQYHSAKTFSAEERRISLSPEHPYSRAVKRLYPVLIKRSNELVEKGVNFIDATPIFDDVDAIIYADSCCHYNDKGSQILADFIVREIGTALLPPNHSEQVRYESIAYNRQ